MGKNKNEDGVAKDDKALDQRKTGNDELDEMFDVLRKDASGE